MRGSAERHHASVRAAARDAMTADHQWRMVTTAARPSHGYVDAARDLAQVLAAVVRSAAAPDLAQPDTALAYVERGLDGALELLRLSAALVDPLVRSEQLFAPARALQPSVERVHARAAGRYVPVSMDEGRPLLEATTQASARLRCALPITVQRPERPVMKTEAPSLTWCRKETAWPGRPTRARRAGWRLGRTRSSSDGQVSFSAHRRGQPATPGP